MTKISNTTKIALLLGAAVVIGGSTLAFAHMDGPMPPDGPMQGLLHRGKMSERLLAEFDTNKDGKITRAEFNNVLGTRFAMATHKKPGMTEDQFIAIHQDDFQHHAAEMFRRIDWNGDGRLSLDEFAAPQRAHFQMMDRDGTGTVSCNPTTHADYRSTSRRRTVTTAAGITIAAAMQAGMAAVMAPAVSAAGISATAAASAVPAFAATAISAETAP